MTEPTLIKRCENCPYTIGAHVHYDGITEIIPDDVDGIYIVRLNGVTLKIGNSRKKENEKNGIRIS